MTADTLFHFSFAVNDLDRARTFYGGLLGCPEGRKLTGRADFNFFGHHIVAHLAPEDVVGDKGRKLSGDATPLRHFGVVTTLEDFEKIAEKLVNANVISTHMAKLYPFGHSTASFHSHPLLKAN